MFRRDDRPLHHQERKIDMKRWIVSKSMLQCDISSCDHWGVEGACKVISIGEDCIVKKICKLCKTVQTFPYKVHKFKDRRPCATASCRHVRDVTVSLFDRVHGNGSAGTTYESFEKYCDACRLEHSAAHHVNQAKIFIERAKSIRTKRKKIVDTETLRTSD
jgi:hypothetical protein